jgi:AcrR family transcriptional regulator
LHQCSNNDRVPTPAHDSLRERKRSETWAALHDAAATLAMHHDSLHHVTVEAIAQRANVSPRTFFNYFASKEDAVLGIREPSIGDTEKAAFTAAADDDLLGHVARLLFQVVRASFEGSRSRAERFTLMARHPELTRRQHAHINRVNELVAGAVAEWLAASPRWRATSTRLDPDEAAQMIVMVAAAATKFAVHQLTASSATPPDDRVAIDHAVTVLREVLRNIT